MSYAYFAFNKKMKRLSTFLNLQSETDALRFVCITSEVVCSFPVVINKRAGRGKS